jgi:hypothetical protein
MAKRKPNTPVSRLTLQERFYAESEACAGAQRAIYLARLEVEKRLELGRLASERFKRIIAEAWSCDWSADPIFLYQVRAMAFQHDLMTDEQRAAYLDPSNPWMQPQPGRDEGAQS